MPCNPRLCESRQNKGEALDNIKEAIALCLEVRAKKGMPLTIETRQIEVAV